MILTPDKYQNALDFLHGQSAHVSKVSQKLLKLVGANHFALIHRENDVKNSLSGFGINVGTMDYWMKHSMPLPFLLPTGFYLTSQFPSLFSEYDLKTLKEKHEVDHILFYVQRNHDNTDVFALSAPPDSKHAINNYINRTADIKKFFIYVKQETKKLLLQAKQNYSIDYDFKPKLQNELFPSGMNVPSYNGFSSLSDIAEMLSPRELMCLELSGATVSIKSIAKKLKLSPRTVESYLLNVRQKLNCDNMAEALDLYCVLSNPP